MWTLLDEELVQSTEWLLIAELRPSPPAAISPFQASLLANSARPSQDKTRCPSFASWVFGEFQSILSRT
ncbi:hypothetical protein VTN96DRAFT_5455 [Rasamsonia emersonii]